MPMEQDSTTISINLDLPTLTICGIVAGLRSGDIKLSLGESVKSTPEIEQWLADVTAKILALYQAELRRRVN